MSNSPILSDDKDLEDLENHELLERIAAMDTDTYPIAERAQAALERIENMDDLQEGSS
jgi:hypothetical protein